VCLPLHFKIFIFWCFKFYRWACTFLSWLSFKKSEIFPSERNSFLNLSPTVLNFSGNEDKIFTFKPAQKSAGSAIKFDLEHLKHFNLEPKYMHSISHKLQTLYVTFWLSSSYGAYVKLPRF
jgi:hypothetical protein